VNKNKNILTVKCYNFDKFGNLLVELFINCENESINDKLINENYCCKFNSKKKKYKYL
jgi:hypothetical protein